MRDLERCTPWRHRRVWVDPKGVNSISIIGEFSSAERAYLNDWINCDKPLVGRVRLSCELNNLDLMPVGLMVYMPGHPKKRISALIDRDSVIGYEEPLQLDKVVGSLPMEMWGNANSILELAKNLPICIRVFGSAFWSYEAKLNHMHANSDLDLLIQFNEFVNPLDLARGLSALSDDMLIRLDGEFEMPDGASVSWRELASNSLELLVKTDVGPKLLSREKLMEQFHVTHL